MKNIHPKEYIDCDQEPIHLCGEIQSFGVLIGTINSKIVFCSENISALFPYESQSLLGENIQVFFEKLDIDINWNNYPTNHELAIQHIDYNGVSYTLSIHKNQEIIYFEIEKVLPNHKINLEYKAIQNILKRANDQNIWRILITEIQEIIDFDRIMVYKFLSDGTGKVIEEISKDNKLRYLNHHFPEFDIPKQARALYLKNSVRITSDSYSSNAFIKGLEKDKIDLTYCTTRATSPIHKEYLKNMEIITNFSVSIIIEGKLWGLVICHHNSFKHIDIQTRLLADTLTRISANAFTSFLSTKTLEDYQKINLSNITLRQNIITEESIATALENNIKSISEICNADGVIISHGENRLITYGNVIESKDLDIVKQWIKNNSSVFSENIFFSSEIPQFLKENLSSPKLFSGCIISLLGEDGSDFIIWTREEQNQNIIWGGKPEKIVDSQVKNGKEIIRYLPRKSFEAWKQSLKGTSKAWTNKDLEAAKWLTSIILKTAHTRIAKIQNLNQQLKELNEELEAFSHTISHDLNTPLTIIKLNAQLLKKQILVNNKTEINIKKIVDQVDTMSDMIKQVLELSRIKKSEVKLDQVDVRNLIIELAEDAKLSYNCPKTQIDISETPDILGNQTMAYQVFTNIIGNAVKYSSKTEQPQVRITGEINENEIIYKITDNGIGINPEEANQVFKIFSRMSNAKSFQGNGVGLNIVYHLMEKMGGKIEYNSIPNKETTFILTFQKPKNDIIISKGADKTLA